MAASRSLALSRATLALSMAVVPSVTRLVLPPMSYCTTQRAVPPLRMRTPKPWSSSSKNVLSLVPGGSASALMLVAVSLIRFFSGQAMGRLGVSLGGPSWPSRDLVI